MSLDDAVWSGCRDGARAGILEALRSPEAQAILRGIVREALGDLVPRLRRLAQLRDEYGIPESTARMWIRQGRLRATKVGGVLLVDVSQLRPVGREEIQALAAGGRR